MKKSKSRASKPNTTAQSYQHMLGQIIDPKDHPTFNLPDAGAGVGTTPYGSAVPPSPDPDPQGTY